MILLKGIHTRYLKTFPAPPTSGGDQVRICFIISF